MREKILTNIFCVISIILFAGLFYYSFTQTGYSLLNLESEAIFFRYDNIFINLLWIIMTIFLLYILKRFIDRFEKQINIRIMAIITSILTMMISFYWVYGSNIGPEADQWNVSFYADAFNAGDFSGFEKGKYIATCPHQLGIVTILRVIYRILGANRYIGFQMLSIVCVGIIIYVGHEIVKILSKENTFAQIIYLFLGLTCFPLYIYTPFIYGEIPSVAVLFIAVWLLLSALTNMRWYKLVGLAVCAGLSVQLRQNSLIVLIGFLVVVIVKIIQQPKGRYFTFIAAILGGYFASNVMIHVLYHDYYKEDAKAIPSILYIAMGTNWEEENPGWFSGYNYSVFFDNDCNQEMASQQAYDDLALFVQKCMNDKGYALDFFGQKILAQWNEPMYHSLVMNKNILAKQEPMIESVYFGNLRSVVENYMNIYQMIIYGSILGLLIVNFRKWNNIDPYVLLIGIFGGFLFSIIWEAKTRYVFPYFIMMLPYAAVGLQTMIESMRFKYSNKR